MGNKIEVILNYSRLLEGSVCTVLLDGAESASRDGDDDSLLELRDIDALLLEIWVATNFATRVILCCTSTVRVSSSDD